MKRVLDATDYISWNSASRNGRQGNDPAFLGQGVDSVGSTRLGDSGPGYFYWAGIR